MIKLLGYSLLYISSLVLSSHPGIKHMPQHPHDLHTVFDFTTEATSGDWMPVNDSVMGGISRSTFEILPEGVGQFTGVVSLENNGGFASIRTLVDSNDFKEYEGIKIRVRGDGQSYSLRLRTDGRLDGVSFRASFDTKKDEWVDVSFPFNTFVPGFRGRTLRNVGPIDPATISQMGLLISDKQTGPFKLQIDWIACY